MNEAALNAKLEQLKAKIAILIKIHDAVPEELGELLDAVHSYEAHSGQINLTIAHFLLNSWLNILDETFPIIQNIIIEQPGNEQVAAEIPEETSEKGVVDQFMQNFSAIITSFYNYLFVAPQAAVQPEVLIDQNGQLIEPDFAGELPKIFEEGCG